MLLRIVQRLAVVCWIISAITSLDAQTPQARGAVGQLYFYTIKDRHSFENGYRQHLEWHAAHHDPLVWYAWSIDSGTRKGAFVDGTFGVTLAGFDSRTDVQGDSADFASNVSPHVNALDTETWTLWARPSTATPLEERHPESTIDVYMLQVDPADIASFETEVEGLSKTQQNTIKLSWYRVVRGGSSPSYALLLSRENWGDLESTGSTFYEMLGRAYAPKQVANILRHLRTIHVETWEYQPRLALIPGLPLEP